MTGLILREALGQGWLSSKCIKYDTSNFGIVVGHLAGNGWKDEVRVGCIGKISTDEELGPETSFVFELTGHRSRYTGFPGPRNPSKPEDALGVQRRVSSPFLD